MQCLLRNTPFDRYVNVGLPNRVTEKYIAEHCYNFNLKIILNFNKPSNVLRDRAVWEHHPRALNHKIMAFIVNSIVLGLKNSIFVSMHIMEGKSVRKGLRAYPQQSLSCQMLL